MRDLFHPVCNIVCNRVYLVFIHLVEAVYLFVRLADSINNFFKIKGNFLSASLDYVRLHFNTHDDSSPISTKCWSALTILIQYLAPHNIILQNHHKRKRKFLIYNIYFIFTILCTISYHLSGPGGQKFSKGHPRLWNLRYNPQPLWLLQYHFP